MSPKRRVQIAKAAKPVHTKQPRPVSFLFF